MPDRDICREACQHAAPHIVEACERLCREGQQPTTPAPDQTEPLVTVAISPEVADDLLSAVGHYRQYTASVSRVVQGRASADDQSHLTRIMSSMDTVAAQLLAQGVGR